MNTQFEQGIKRLDDGLRATHQILIDTCDIFIKDNVQPEMWQETKNKLLEQQKQFLPCFDPSVISDGENVPSQEGEGFKIFQQEKYGGEPQRIEPKKPYKKFDRASYQRNKDFFLTDREKDAANDEYLLKHGINF